PASPSCAGHVCRTGLHSGTPAIRPRQDLKSDFPAPRNSNQGMTPYIKFLQEGLVVGLRRFHFL
ncbi:unnamed protein product, partial [Closterium sp. Naga37s-1]